MAKQFTLGKNEKLKSRKQIDLLFSEGKKIVVSPFRILFCIRESSLAASDATSLLQFSAAVSSKIFKKAVDRNRIKRLIREAWRLQKNELKEKLETDKKQMNVFFIYTGKTLPTFPDVKDAVAIGLKKLLKLAHENIAAHS